MFAALYVIYQLSEIQDNIQVVSQFSCLLGHPVCILLNTEQCQFTFPYPTNIFINTLNTLQYSKDKTPFQLQPFI